MGGQNYIPAGARAEVERMYVAITLVKSVVDAGHATEGEAETIAQNLADLEVKAGDLAASFRDRLSGDLVDDSVINGPRGIGVVGVPYYGAEGEDHEQILADANAEGERELERESQDYDEEPDVDDDFPIELEYGVPGVNAPAEHYGPDEEYFGRNV